MNFASHGEQGLHPSTSCWVSCDTHPQSLICSMPIICHTLKLTNVNRTTRHVYAMVVPSDAFPLWLIQYKRMFDISQVQANVIGIALYLSVSFLGVPLSPVVLVSFIPPIPPHSIRHHVRRSPPPVFGYHASNKHKHNHRRNTTTPLRAMFVIIVVLHTHTHTHTLRSHG